MAKGEFFIEKGDAGHEMYFIVEGTADVLLERDGEPVGTREMGEFVGETALLESAPRKAGYEISECDWSSDVCAAEL
eukprot:COSAG06_NODE_39869_length_408_cov_0.475728_1_plen_77_part_00